MEPQSAQRRHRGVFFVPRLLSSALSHFIFRISTSPEKWITHHGEVSITFSDSKRIIWSIVCAFKWISNTVHASSCQKKRKPERGLALTLGVLTLVPFLRLLLSSFAQTQLRNSRSQMTLSPLAHLPFLCVEIMLVIKCLIKSVLSIAHITAIKYLSAYRKHSIHSALIRVN